MTELSLFELAGSLPWLVSGRLVRKGSDRAEGGSGDEITGEGLNLKTLFIGNFHKIFVRFLIVSSGVPVKSELAIFRQQFLRKLIILFHHQSRRAFIK